MTQIKDRKVPSKEEEGDYIRKEEEKRRREQRNKKVTKENKGMFRKPQSLRTVSESENEMRSFLGGFGVKRCSGRSYTLCKPQ